MMNWSTYITAVLLFNTLDVYSFGADSENEVQSASCTNRFEYRHILKAKNSDCREVLKHNSICGTNVTIAYSEHPPYVFVLDGKVTGILPGTILYDLYQRS